MKAKAERKTANALYMMVFGFGRYEYKIVNAMEYVHVELQPSSCVVHVVVWYCTVRWGVDLFDAQHANNFLWQARAKVLVVLAWACQCDRTWSKD